jgi:hypothetical protein
MLVKWYDGGYRMAGKKFLIISYQVLSK